MKGNDPTALSVLTQAITGQVGFMDAEFCTTCGEKGAQKRCSICKTVRDGRLNSPNAPGDEIKTFFSLFQVIYCGQTCQKMHWFTHKKVCKKLQEQREKQEAEAAKLRMQQSKGQTLL